MTDSTTRPPRTRSGEAHHLYLHACDGFVTELDDETPTSGYCPAEPGEVCGYVTEIARIEAEAAAPDQDKLVDIIEQAIFETDTGLEAALLAAERIEAARG